MDVTQSLIQSKGYNAISFNDIAEQVGIKKPSIVHHYSSKAALGEAVVQRYRKYYSSALAVYLDDKSRSLKEAFDFYCAPYLELGESNEKICLCGALAGEFLALPESMQREVQDFFESHMQWLEQILVAGIESGDFQFDAKPRFMAELILNALQGASIIQRSAGDAAYMQKTIDLLKRQVFK